jgi:hypothetical protein
LGLLVGGGGVWAVHNIAFNDGGNHDGLPYWTNVQLFAPLSC